MISLGKFSRGLPARENHRINGVGKTQMPAHPDTFLLFCPVPYALIKENFNISR